MINAGNVAMWKSDVAASVNLYNTWFFGAAPAAYRNARASTIRQVKGTMQATSQMRDLTPALLAANPGIITALRMMTAPPLARDRLIGLGDLDSANLIKTMERGSLPPRMPSAKLQTELAKICATITRLVDRGLMPWLDTGATPSADEEDVAVTVVADRLCGALSDPIVRNAQERRQLALISDYLDNRGYMRKTHPVAQPLSSMAPGTYSLRQNVVVGRPEKQVNIPIDVMIQPMKGHSSGLPILVECKSAGDFTNTNKRRKEEAQKAHQLRAKFGPDVPFILFLCGYFDSGYLGYEAAEGIDWIWEHRITDMDLLGL